MLREYWRKVSYRRPSFCSSLSTKLAKNPRTENNRLHACDLCWIDLYESGVIFVTLFVAFVLCLPYSRKRNYSVYVSAFKQKDNFLTIRPSINIGTREQFCASLRLYIRARYLVSTSCYIFLWNNSLAIRIDTTISLFRSTWCKCLFPS